LEILKLRVGGKFELIERFRLVVFTSLDFDHDTSEYQARLLRDRVFEDPMPAHNLLGKTIFLLRPPPSGVV
jgi:hypothetical protein